MVHRGELEVGGRRRTGEEDVQLVQNLGLIVHTEGSETGVVTVMLRQVRVNFCGQVVKWKLCIKYRGGRCARSCQMNSGNRLAPISAREERRPPL